MQRCGGSIPQLKTCSRSLPLPRFQSASHIWLQRIDRDDSGKVSTKELSRAFKSMLNQQPQNRASHRASRSPKRSHRQASNQPSSQEPLEQYQEHVFDEELEPKFKMGSDPVRDADTTDPASLGGHMPFAGKFVIGQGPKQTQSKQTQSNKNLPVRFSALDSSESPTKVGRLAIGVRANVVGYGRETLRWPLDSLVHC